MDKPLIKGLEEVYRNSIASDETDVMKASSTKMELLAEENEETSLSSFGGSDSEAENDDVTDSEAVSGSWGDVDAALDSGCREAFNMRKKKPTTHWRSFIQPLMWRVKWIELQMKNLRSQAEKYDRKIEKYRKRKQVRDENTTSEGIGRKSIPFSWNVPRSVVLARKKRKRTETTTDLAAYLSRHSLFSYYENHKSLTGGDIMLDNSSNAAKPSEKVNMDDELQLSNDLLCLQPGHNDNMECLLQKIDLLQSRVGILKDRADVTISDNPEMYPDVEILPMLYNDSRSSLDYNASSSNNDASQVRSEYTSAVPTPETAVSGHTEDFPDVNGSGALDSLADSLKNGEAEVLTIYPTVKEEKFDFEEIIIQQAQNTELMNSGVSSTAPVVEAEPDSHGEDPPPNIPTSSVVTAPRRKKRKVRRKGSSRWI